MDFFLSVRTELDIDELIKYYFKVRPKFKYIDICSIFSQHHRKNLTLQQLKTRLKKKLHLSRKRNVLKKIQWLLFPMN